MQHVLKCTGKIIAGSVGRPWHVLRLFSDVVIFYALPELVERLRSKLVAELPVGAIAVSHRFPVTAWDPLHVSGAQGEWKMFVYDVHAAEAATATRRKARRQQ